MVNNPRAALFKRFLRLGLGVACIAGVLYLVNTDELLQALSQVSARDVLLLVGLSCVLIGVSVLKWQLFLAHLGIRNSFVKLFGLYLVGYFVNMFTPSFIGGDVVRSMAMGPGVDRAHAVSATFLERYTGIVAMLAMAACAAAFSDAITPQIVWTVVAAVCACVVGTWLVAAGVLSAVVTFLRLPGAARTIVDRVYQGLLLGLSDRRLLARALVLSVIFHLLTIVNTVAVGAAVGWEEIPWKGLLVVVPLILLIGAIPVAPQGLGIQEGAFVYFLHAVGATTGQALAIALVLRAKSYLLAAAGGVVWLVAKNHLVVPAVARSEVVAEEGACGSS
jgi:uncharacterized protein (TIRG00374 family)